MLHPHFVVAVLSDLLLLYSFDPITGAWEHIAGAGGELTGRALPESALAAQLADARRIIGAAGRRPPRPPADQPLPVELERHRWFPLPGDDRASSGRFRSDRRRVLSP